jgi:hypothetical protein
LSPSPLSISAQAQRSGGGRPRWEGVRSSLSSSERSTATSLSLLPEEHNHAAIREQGRGHDHTVVGEEEGRQISMTSSPLRGRTSHR